MQQGNMTIAAFGAKFRGQASRIAVSKVGTAVDSTTQAVWFLSGLKKSIVNRLQGNGKPADLQNIDTLISAAEQVEANLSMSAQVATPEQFGTSSQAGRAGRFGRANAFVARNTGGRFGNRPSPYSSGRGRYNRLAYVSNNAVGMIDEQDADIYDDYDDYNAENFCDGQEGPYDDEYYEEGQLPQFNAS